MKDRLDVRQQQACQLSYFAVPLCAALAETALVQTQPSTHTVVPKQVSKCEAIAA